MSNKQFSGAVAKRYYRWGYTCEFCGKDIDNTAYISAQHGVTHKYTSTVYVNQASVTNMEAQAKMKLLQKMSEMESTIRNGNFDPPSNDSGKCPYCKEFQHWAPSVKGYLASQEEKASKKSIPSKILRFIGHGLLYLFIGGLAAIALFVIVFLFMKIFKVDDAVIGQTFNYIYVIGTLIFTAVTILLKKQYDKRVAKRIRKLEGVKKTNPHFIAWGKEDIYTTGLH